MGTLHKLSDSAIRSTMVPGRYSDGGGLYLRVSDSGQKSWVFRYRVHGYERDMGLGSYPAVKLSLARSKAAECRDMRARGIDPLKEREAAALAASEATARAMTFEECGEKYITAHEASWKNAKHRQQWRNTLKTYVHPVLGSLAVQAIDTALVSKVLEPIWHTKPETAGRVRGRIEVVLDWAKVRGHRDGENPARWRGHLDMLLPSRSKLRKVKHHPALPFDDMHAFISVLHQREGIAALALEFLILTVGRTVEVTEARWAEIDQTQRLWIVPPGRMKGSREHRVPLTNRALAILAIVKPLRRDDGFLFPGEKKDKPLSNGAFLALLERMGRGDITPHGFRSSFDDWAAERTAFPREVAEMALSHAVKDKVEAAYRRGDLLDKRRALMAAWAEFCTTPPAAGNVVEFVRAESGA